MTQNDGGKPPSFLTGTDISLMYLPSINSNFPLYMDGGNAWAGIDAECDLCGKIVPHHQFTGRVNKLSGIAAQLEAVAYCEGCHHCTQYSKRLHHDMTMSGMYQGKWVTSSPEKTSFIMRLFNATHELLCGLYDRI